jgi:hypothetical protein
MPPFHNPRHDPFVRGSFESKSAFLTQKVKLEVNQSSDFDAS